MTISFRNIRPDDGNALQRATRKAEQALQACAPAAGITLQERERVAEAVVWIARSGYSRRLDGLFDEEALSQAALARLRSVFRPS